MKLLNMRTRVAFWSLSNDMTLLLESLPRQVSNESYDTVWYDRACCSMPFNYAVSGYVIPVVVIG